MNRKLPPMPDRWARVYETHTANPSWIDPASAQEPQMGRHIGVVRYVAVPESFEHADRVVFSLSASDVAERAGRELTDAELDRFADAFPNTSVGDCIEGCIDGLLS
jgi:hypothetical protein